MFFDSYIYIYTYILVGFSKRHIGLRCPTNIPRANLLMKRIVMLRLSMLQSRADKDNIEHFVVSGCRPSMTWGIVVPLSLYTSVVTHRGWRDTFDRVPQVHILVCSQSMVEVNFDIGFRPVEECILFMNTYLISQLIPCHLVDWRLDTRGKHAKI